MSAISHRPRGCRAPYGARGLKSAIWLMICEGLQSRPVWGAWIEITWEHTTMSATLSRAPYGARGLKLFSCFLLLLCLWSRPVWGAWIEISCAISPVWGSQLSRPVWGAWIEISFCPHSFPNVSRRAPYGARGLKSKRMLKRGIPTWSRPVWGAWIEITTNISRDTVPHSRAPYGARGLKSPGPAEEVEGTHVAPRMGRVD